MPQGPIPAAVAISTAKAGAPMQLDTVGNLETTAGGVNSKLNLTAAGVIKATPGRLCKVVVIAGGTASDGDFTLNDCATTGAAAAANVIASIPAGTTAGTVIDLQWPCAVGIVLSAVPSAGSPILAVSYS